MMQGEMSRMIYFHVENCTSGSNGPNPSMPSASSENNAPSEAMIQLMAPDGYYKYLGVDKSVATASADEAPQIDLDKVKKSYRKLSLKHHPDKPSGDVDTFRLLNRAHRVLTDPKLRQQYDILGLDLADEQVDEQHQEDDEKPQEATTAQTIITEIAGYVLTFVVQLLVRTAVLAFLSLILVRYRWLFYPALVGLSYIVFKNYQSTRALSDIASPLTLAAGIVLMNSGLSTEVSCTWKFLFGEATVIAAMTFNSAPVVFVRAPILFLPLGIMACLAALWFRGSFWNYVTVLVLESVLLLLVAVAFPLMEMVLEAILNEKLKKVGERVRAHHVYMEAYYQSKLDARNK